VLANRRIGDREPEQRTEDRRRCADLDALDIRAPVRLVEERRDVGRGPAAVDVLECPDDDRAGGEEQEQEGVREERQRREPRQGKAPPAERDVRPECL
jgi:hypothetical protein